jgi:hypothetical protein
VARVDPAVVARATQAEPSRTRWGIVAVPVVVLVLFVLATRMVPHPVGPARTFDKYRGKAVTTAESSQSDVETVLLAADAASRGNAFGSFVTTVVVDAEDGLSGRQGTFDSIQPPDARADELGAELDGILNTALEHVTDVRIAARRGELGDLARIAEPLRGDARALQAFAERHG